MQLFCSIFPISRMGRTATAARLFPLTPTASRCWSPPRGRCLIAPANSSRAFSRYSPERIRDALLSFGRFRHCLRDIPPQRPHADSNTDKRWGLTVAEAGRVLSLLMRPVSSGASRGRQTARGFLFARTDCPLERFRRRQRLNAADMLSTCDSERGSVAVVAKCPKGSLQRTKSIQGSVTAQACTNQICLPPSTLTISTGVGER